MTDISTRAEKRASERRAVAKEFELRSAPDGSGGNTLTFTGYASVTETPYEMEDIFGPYSEVISRGAFAKTLMDGADVPFKLNHDGLSLARTKSGTMKLSEDDTGLYVEAQLDPASPAVQTLRSAVQRGDLDEMSFGFRVIRQEWSPDYMERRISEVSLHKGDVSLVNYGANPHTGGLVDLRSREFAASLAELSDDERERILRALARPPAEDAVLADYLASLAVRKRASNR